MLRRSSAESLARGLDLVQCNIHTFHVQHCRPELSLTGNSQIHQIRLTIVNRVSSSSLGLFCFPFSSRPDPITLVSLESRSPISGTGAASSRALCKMSLSSRLYFCTPSTGVLRVRNWEGKDTAYPFFLSFTYGVSAIVINYILGLTGLHPCSAARGIAHQVNTHDHLDQNKAG